MKHKAKPSGSSGGSRLRLTILLATVAAFLLVPVAQAAAEGTLTVNIEGIEGGSGEVNSFGGIPSFGGSGEGEPPIECSGPPSSGTCETELEELEEGFNAIGLHAIAAPESNLVGWEIEGAFNPEGTYCPFSAAGPGSADSNECVALGFGGNVTVTAYFEFVGPRLTVAKEGTGLGTVVSSPGGVLCGKVCSAAFEESSVVTLTASPAAGSVFTSWKGCDTV